MNNYYIYIHYTKDTNEPFYVGKGKNYRISTKSRRSDFWKNIVNKHGYYYEILEDKLTEKESFELEKFYITYLKFLGFNLCNLTDGGEGSSGHKFVPSKEWCDEKSKSQSGSNNHFFNKKHTQESKDKIAKSRIGKEPSNKIYFTKEEKKEALRRYSKARRDKINPNRKTRGNYNKSKI